jgi:hypothetical protein
VLLLSTVLIIFFCLMQDQKQDQNMTSAITGGTYDSAFSKNEGNTKEETQEALLSPATRVSKKITASDSSETESFKATDSLFRCPVEIECIDLVKQLCI